MTRRSLALMGLFAVAPVAAQTPTKVSGTFTSKDVSFKVAGAVAFNGKSHMNDTTPVVLVAISNTGSTPTPWPTSSIASAPSRS